MDNYLSVKIDNSVFTLPGSGEDVSAIYCYNAILLFNGPVVFNNFNSKNDSIIFMVRTNVTFHGRVDFFGNKAVSLLHQSAQFRSLQLEESLLFNISNNNFSSEIFSTGYIIDLWDFHIVQPLYPMCFFQYVSDCGSLENKFLAGETINFSIIIYKTMARSLTDSRTTHCKWQPNTAFSTTSPLLVNQRYISDFDKWNDIPIAQSKRSLCSCSDGGQFVNCSIDTLGPIYPGQDAVFSLAMIQANHNTSEIVPIFIETIIYSSLQCVIPTASIQQNVSRHGCSNVSYTLLSNNIDMCELILKQRVVTTHGIKALYNIFYMKLLHCPPGFVHSDMRCQCDPILILHQHVEQCDINDQTVLRAPNSWILYSKLHSYMISKKCPFEYCYPESSKINLNYPDLQCQFSRSGDLCGQCIRNLSTIFGSFECRKCSNLYLFIMVPIAISGVVLVMVLFTLNLTVSEGIVVPFILYVNIVSINSVPLFPSHFLVKPLHYFISAMNLNLGIETCFYNGMDNYAKMWLQFSFPIYLIIIITSVSIASHYSIVLQRLTLHKIAPVFATILLLSHTKLLQTVSNVLFVYSTITHYPSNVSTVVWSIDANIPLFGLHHSLLFAFSILIFLLLIMYTGLLLFGKHMTNLKVYVHFNPLINAYSKAYKEKYWYWIGYELIIRCALLGTLAANKTNTLIIGNCFLSLVAFNFQHPFEKHVNNISQMLYFLNVLVLYATSMMFPETQSIRVVIANVMVGCAFAQFIVMIVIDKCYCKCVNMVSCYVHQIVFRGKYQEDIDVLLTRQDCGNSVNNF